MSTVSYVLNVGIELSPTSVPAIQLQHFRLLTLSPFGLPQRGPRKTLEQPGA